MAGCLQVNVPRQLQDLIKQKQTLKELKQELFEKVYAEHHTFHFFLDNDNELFQGFWRELIEILNSILNFCYRYRIVLKYEERYTTVAEWYRPYLSHHRGDMTVLHIFDKYLASEIVNNLPEGRFRDFFDLHRDAIHKYEDLLTSI
jgi:hypothetical protein